MIGYSYTHEIQKNLGKRKFKSKNWKGRDSTRRIDIHCLICQLFFHRFNFHIYCDFNENIFLIKKKYMITTSSNKAKRKNFENGKSKSLI